MTKTVKTVLVISTDATRTGTPILLLENLKWLKANSDLNFIIILQNGGSLLSEFQKIAKVFIWSEHTKIVFKNPLDTFIKKVKIKLGYFSPQTIISKFIETLQKENDIKLIYNNTTRNGEILASIQAYLKCKVITHVHEGEKFLKIWDADGMVSYSVNHSESFIAVSEYVKLVLQNSFGVKRDIVVIPGVVQTNVKQEKNPETLKKELNIPLDAIILLSCGWLGWHKGVDFFIQIARKLSLLNKEIYMVWLGGNESDITYQQMEHDIEKLQLSTKVKLVTSKQNVQDYYNIADIFLMLSREESFSLVTAEAGWASIPVICFESSGGPNEIVNFDERFMVPYADIDMLYSKILNLINMPDERKKMGALLHERIEQNYVVDKVAPKLLECILNYMH